ncbi:hypothetical protein GWK47_028222 [Chionoecetes opilio]|uniref:Uncharacterized protein n=1 Tax=Chionoecetes opilio TaxID=41210 RepID=A0A8J4YXN3_CHIOP|nr:hypothetical protein GWK47_028222 [Chionoecetes opilio]
MLTEPGANHTCHYTPCTGACNTPGHSSYTVRLVNRKPGITPLYGSQRHLSLPTPDGPPRQDTCHVHTYGGRICQEDVLKALRICQLEESLQRGKHPGEGLGMTPGIEAVSGRCALSIYGPVETTLEIKSGSPQRGPRTELETVWGRKRVENPGGVSSDSRSISVWNISLPDVLVRWKGRPGSQ